MIPPRGPSSGRISSSVLHVECLGANMEDNEIGHRAERMRGEAEQDFIPGLPDDVVKEHISTKIPWSAVLALSKVNRKWRGAIRSREIHDLRKRSGAAKSMTVVPVSRTTHTGFYDMESRGTYLFPFPPPAPKPPNVYSETDYDNWMADEYGCIPASPVPEVRTSDYAYTIGGLVFLDGKLYAIRTSGGNMEDILVLDVGACESEWKICTRWEMCTYSVTKYFRAKVKNRPTELWVACNGKIYSFHTCSKAFHGKVFDPKSNQWTEIEQRPVNVCHPSHYDRRRLVEYDSNALCLQGFAHRTGVFNKEIYVGWTWGKEIMIFDSVTEKWRLIRNTLTGGIGGEGHGMNCFNMLEINEKFYNFSLCVDIYDQQSNSWARSQETFHEHFVSSADVAAVITYGNELLAMLDSENDYALDHFTDYGEKPSTRRFCKSVGFGVDGQTLTWEDVPDFPFSNCFYSTSGFQLGCLDL